MASSTTLFRARVPTSRLRNAEKVLARLGLKPGDAFNMLLAQVELQKGLPFKVTTVPDAQPLLSAEEQASAWQKTLGEYKGVPTK
jgi:addiction module RelB/DinJ family antitoxin